MYEKDSNTLNSMERLPFISVIMPIRNEGQYISASLNSILSQDYPADLLEILVVDGMSDDATRQIIQKISRDRSKNSQNISFSSGGMNQVEIDGKSKDKPPIILLDNPGRIVPTAFNIGLRQAKGEIIVRVDGHCVIVPDYVRRCVELLEKTGADNVGGLQKAVGEGLLGRAISLATCSPFGVGGARFHYAKEPGWADTVYLGAYKREVFERVGGFDEELVRNQDDEFNFRLLQAGGKIWLDPSIKSIYYSRTTLGRLWRQYFQYGFYKVRVIQKRQAVASWRHLIPAGFVSALIFGVFLSSITGHPFFALAIGGPYFLANISASLWAARKDWPTLPFLSLAFLILHTAYGVGFLWGLWRWRHGWQLRILRT